MIHAVVIHSVVLFAILCFCVLSQTEEVEAQHHEIEVLLANLYKLRRSQKS